MAAFAKRLVARVRLGQGVLCPECTVQKIAPRKAGCRAHNDERPNGGSWGEAPLRSPGLGPTIRG
jgi:hypothetical protein